MSEGQELALGIIIGILMLRWLGSGRLQNILNAASGKNATPSGPQNPFSSSTNPLTPVDVGKGGDLISDPFSSISLAGTYSDNGNGTWNFTPSGVINYMSNGKGASTSVSPSKLPAFNIGEFDPNTDGPPQLQPQYILQSVIPNIPSTIPIDGFDNPSNSGGYGPGTWSQRVASNLQSINTFF